MWDRIESIEVAVMCALGIALASLVVGAWLIRLL